jgi:hypothetical protein
MPAASNSFPPVNIPLASVPLNHSKYIYGFEQILDGSRNGQIATVRRNIGSTSLIPHSLMSNMNKSSSHHVLSGVVWSFRNRILICSECVTILNTNCVAKNTSRHCRRRRRLRFDSCFTFVRDVSDCPATFPASVA